MRKEIDILVEAARKECAVVEKASHLLWTYEELREAGAAGLYQGPVRLLPPDGSAGVTSPFPGCFQRGGAAAGAGGFHAVGQTEHFVIFIRAPPEHTPEREGCRGTVRRLAAEAAPPSRARGGHGL
jgi:hypothetical protein